MDEYKATIDGVEFRARDGRLYVTLPEHGGAEIVTPLDAVFRFCLRLPVSLVPNVGLDECNKKD